MKDESSQKTPDFFLLRSSFILHPSSFILHPSSFILHPSSFILHPSSFILHPSSFILHPSLRVRRRQPGGASARCCAGRTRSPPACPAGEPPLRPAPLPGRSSGMPP